MVNPRLSREDTTSNLPHQANIPLLLSSTASILHLNKAATINNLLLLRVNTAHPLLRSSITTINHHRNLATASLLLHSRTATRHNRLTVLPTELLPPRASTASRRRLNRMASNLSTDNRNMAHRLPSRIAMRPRHLPRSATARRRSSSGTALPTRTRCAGR